jgi:hypothetical protein
VDIVHQQKGRLRPDDPRAVVHDPNVRAQVRSPRSVACDRVHDGGEHIDAQFSAGGLRRRP